MRTAAAVNCLVREPRRNLVCGVLGTSSSKFAMPYPRLTSTLPPRATRIEPLNRLLLIAALTYSSTLEASPWAGQWAIKRNHTEHRKAAQLIRLTALFMKPSDDTLELFDALLLRAQFSKLRI